ncbi:MAG: prepilin-type N-terminal cleavage/methylation domain-containing protein [Clostridia bacterium]
MNTDTYKTIKKWLCQKKGMSLIEVLAAITILGIIAAPLTTMFITAIRTDFDAENKLRAMTVAESCMEQQKTSNTLPDTVVMEEIASNDSRYKAYRSIQKEPAISPVVREAYSDSLTQDSLLFLEIYSDSITVTYKNNAGIVDTRNDDFFNFAGDNIRRLIVRDAEEGGGFEYTNNNGSDFILQGTEDIENVVIMLKQNLEHNFYLNISNGKNEMIDVDIYNNNGVVEVSSLNGDISVQDALTTESGDYDDLAVYAITITVQDTFTNTQVQLHSKKMMYK